MTESPFPHKNTIFVSGSYSGNITPFDVSNSTITMGSLKASGARNEYCRSDVLLNLWRKKANIQPIEICIQLLRETIIYLYGELMFSVN